MDLCNKDLMSIYELIGIVFKIIKLVVPLIIIFFGTLDFFKSVVSANDIKLSQSVSSFSKRLIAGLLIFILPSIILFTLDLVGLDRQGNSCIYTCVLDTKTCSSSQNDDTGNNNSNNNSNNDLINNNDDSIDYSIYVE